MLREAASRISPRSLSISIAELTLLLASISMLRRSTCSLVARALRSNSSMNVWSMVRSRTAIFVRRLNVNSLLSFVRRRISCWLRSTAVHSSIASALAERGIPSTTESSPKKSPSCRTPSSDSTPNFVYLLIRTRPCVRQYISRPLDDSSKIMSPAANRRSCAPATTERMVFGLTPLKRMLRLRSARTDSASERGFRETDAARLRPGAAVDFFFFFGFGMIELYSREKGAQSQD